MVADVDRMDGRVGAGHVHVEAAERVAVQAHRVGVERLAHVSGLGADAASPSLYIRKRGEGERSYQEARQFGAFETQTGILRKRGTAWWAREDPNLQPLRYEPIPPSAGSRDCTSRI